MDPIIHETAEVSDKTSIGQGTRIWHQAQIKEGAVVGENCIIGHNCCVMSGAIIGNGVKIQSNTDVWQGVTLEDYVFIGPSAVFTNDPNPRAKYPKKEFPQYGQWRPTIIKEGATIGANSTIVCGIAVGKWAFIAAGAVVSKDVPDYALVMGVPAKHCGWMCECANKLDFKNNKAICGVCGREYAKKNEQVIQVK